MTENKGVLSSGLSMVMRNKRYILWFWLLDVLLTIWGTSAFREAAHTVLDHSLYSEKMLHGFDLGVLLDLFARPELGPSIAMTTPAVYFAIIFFLATALFLPGVFAGYASFPPPALWAQSSSANLRFFCCSFRDSGNAESPSPTGNKK